jgi:hypothetical protein
MVACAYGPQLILCKHIPNVLSGSATWMGATDHTPPWILALCQGPETRKEGMINVSVEH